MAHKLQIDNENTKEMWFPPEADGDFSVVDTSKIADWREKLADRFSIGAGKMTPVDDPVNAR